MGRKLLITGAILNFIIAAGHIVAMCFIEQDFDLIGLNVSVENYQNINIGYKYLATSIMIIVFIMIGIYGLSAARIIKKLPLLKPALAIITIVYIARGILGLAYEILSQEQWLYGIIIACIALFIGICYLSGGLWRWHGKGQGKYFGEQ